MQLTSYINNIVKRPTKFIDTLMNFRKKGSGSSPADPFYP